MEREKECVCGPEDAVCWGVVERERGMWLTVTDWDDGHASLVWLTDEGACQSQRSLFKRADAERLIAALPVLGFAGTFEVERAGS